MAPGRDGSRAAGAWYLTCGAARQIGEAVPVAVELAGKRNRGGELRRGVEGGGDASEERSGARGSRGGRLTLQMAARAAGGQGKPVATVLQRLRRS